MSRCNCPVFKPTGCGNVPGAVDTGAGDQRTIRFAGHGLDDNNLTLDGGWPNNPARSLSLERHERHPAGSTSDGSVANAKQRGKIRR